MMFRLLKVLSVIAVFLVAALSLNALFWADEFHFLVMMRQMTVWEFMLLQYQTWDGRFLSLNAWAQLQLIRLGMPQLAVGVWTLMLWITAWLVWRVHCIGYGNRRTSGFLPVSIIFCLLWLGFSPVIAETLYWVTGGIYTLGLAMMLLFVAGWYARPAAFSGGWLIAGAMYCVLSGLMGVTASFPLMVFLFTELILQKARNSLTGASLKYALFCGMGLLAGSLVNISAPGNYLRAGLLETSFVWDAGKMFVDFLKIGWRYINLSVVMLAAGILALLILPNPDGHTGKKYFYFSFDSSFSFTRQELIVLLERHRWLVVAFSSALPMVVIPDIAGGRTAVYFMLFIFMWVLQWGSGFIKYEGEGWRFSLSNRMQNLMGVLFFTSVILLALHHGHMGRQIVQQVAQREQYLTQMQGVTDTVQVAPIRVSHMPYSIFFVDLLDPWYAYYYGFKAIGLKIEDGETLPGYYLEPRWGGYVGD